MPENGGDATYLWYGDPSLEASEEDIRRWREELEHPLEPQIHFDDEDFDPPEGDTGLCPDER